MFNTKEKRERALGTKLLLKAYRCSSPKCATVRNPYAPGQHGKKRKRASSEMGEQLKEKQKIKATYGIREAAMRRVFKAAAKSQGITGFVIMMLLERRLDNVVYRLGFAPSRSVGRQLVSHGHITVNGRKVTIPSYLIKPGDLISVRAASSEHPLLKNLKEEIKKYEAPVWLSIDKEKVEGKVSVLPKDFDIPFNVDMVVEYYSKI